MNKIQVFLSMFFILVIYSCSKGTMYTAVQHYQRAECLRVPLSQHDRCLDELDMHYHMYRSKREELFEETTSSDNIIFYEETKPAPSVRF